MQEEGTHCKPRIRVIGWSEDGSWYDNNWWMVPLVFVALLFIFLMALLGLHRDTPDPVPCKPPTVVTTTVPATTTTTIHITTGTLPETL
jgi:hypothetical protein